MLGFVHLSHEHMVSIPATLNLKLVQMELSILRFGLRAMFMKCENDSYGLIQVFSKKP